MSEVIRYVHIENKKVEIKESFLGFSSANWEESLDKTEDILKVIERDGLDITMCRGQGYNKASTTAGEHSGYQARICQLNELFVQLKHCLYPVQTTLSICVENTLLQQFHYV
ncbi:hypothetical protein AVEN_225294-1 [Araneus ventricosus]|uniref:DUF4371 domain-containing protein n=1 Tax=Araneus ventricosus TaxID=182803 RepID=A0A4Y2ALU9_ARAVE|nr:hypothetical protein AVEN_225294-1 [Araneus ventricosus]